MLFHACMCKPKMVKCKFFFFFFPPNMLRIATHLATYGRKKGKYVSFTKGKTNICKFFLLSFLNLSLIDINKIMQIIFETEKSFEFKKVSSVFGSLQFSQWMSFMILLLCSKLAIPTKEPRLYLRLNRTFICTISDYWSFSKW